MSASYQRAWVLYYQLKRYDMAERELRGVLVDRPDDPYAHALLGLALTQRRQFPEAASEVREAIRLAPNLAFAHYARARLLGARNMLKAAQAAIDEAIRLDPIQADYFSWLSAFRYDTGQWRSALKAAEHGLELDPVHVSCANLRALALAKLGHKKEARATSLAALARDPENAITHAIQGTTLLRQAEYGEALVHFREARRLDPLSEWAHRGYRSARTGYWAVWAAQTLGRGVFRLAFRKRSLESRSRDLPAGWLGACLMLGALLLTIGCFWWEQDMFVFTLATSALALLLLWLGLRIQSRFSEFLKISARLLTLILGVCTLGILPEVVHARSRTMSSSVIVTACLVSWISAGGLLGFLFALSYSGLLADNSLPRRK